MGNGQYRNFRANIPVDLGGLINFNVGLVTAHVGEDTSLNTLCVGTGEDEKHQHDPVRIRQKLICPTCYNDDKLSFVKGRELPDGTFALVSEDERDAILTADERVKAKIELSVHPAEGLVGTLPGEKAYYMPPSKGTGYAYAAVGRVLERRPDLAFTTVFATNTVPTMFRLGVREGVLMLTEVVWPQEVREAPLLPAFEVPAGAEDIVEQFVDTLVTPYDETNYRDTRADALDAFLASAQGLEPGETLAAAPKKAGADLLSLLGAAVKAKQAEKKPAKKVAARKPAAKAAKKKVA